MNRAVYATAKKRLETFLAKVGDRRTTLAEDTQLKRLRKDKLSAARAEEKPPKSKLSPQRVAELRRERELVLRTRNPLPLAPRRWTRWERAVHESEHAVCGLALGVLPEQLTLHHYYGSVPLDVRIIAAPAMLSPGDRARLHAANVSDSQLPAVRAAGRALVTARLPAVRAVASALYQAGELPGIATTRIAEAAMREVIQGPAYMPHAQAMEFTYE